MRAARRTSAHLALALALALGLALGACVEDPADGGDTLAAGNVAAALDAGGELSRLVVPLEASADLGLLDPTAARARKVQNAIDAFRALVADPACVKVTTDNLTYLDVTFDRCRIALLLSLDGSLRASVAIEVAGVTPVGVVGSVTIPSLVLTGPLRSRRLSGELELHHRISPLGAPVELDGELRVSPDGAGELSLSLGAAWTVTGDCVSLTAGAELSGAPLGELGPIALSGEGVRVCRNACPTAGSVELSYGRGALLAWTYTGASTVSVIGPRGKRVEVPLACGDG
jgi:hypothetical protein